MEIYSNNRYTIETEENDRGSIDVFITDKESGECGSLAMLDTARRAETEGADYLLCANVLNVLSEAERHLEYGYLANLPIDYMYFSVYEGDRSGIRKETKIGTRQNNLKAAAYETELSKYFNTVERSGSIIYASN